MTRATSVYFDEETDKLLKVYVDSHSISKSEFIKQAVAKQLEDCLDVEAADFAFQEWEKDNFKTISWEESLKEFGLKD